MVSKKYSRKRISKRRRNLKLRSRRMSGGRPEPELEKFTIEFTYDDEIYNIIIKKSKTNYSLEVKKSNDS